jgi:hypothetical protein
MKMKKFISLLAATCMLASSAAALAAAPSSYDGKAYDSLGYTSEDPDGQINLAVIANGDVKLIGNAMYIRGSVYSNGTIYGDDGGGNFVEGLLISGTQDSVYDTEVGSTVYNGYIPVTGSDLSTSGITGYSTQIDTNGAIYDANTTAVTCDENYSGNTVDTTGFDTVSNYVYASPYGNAVTVSKDTYFSNTLYLYNNGLTIDVSNNDVTVVIENYDANNPIITIAGSGSGHKAKIYIKDYASSSLARLELNVDESHFWDCWNPPSSTATVFRSSVSAFDEYLSTVYDYYNTYLANSSDAVELHLANGGDGVTIEGGKIAADLYIDAPSVAIQGQTEIKGDIHTNASAVTMTGGSTYVLGNVCAPAAETEVINSAMIIGQLVTDTLVCNGTGKIVYYADTMDKEITSVTPTLAPNATSTPAPNTTPTAAPDNSKSGDTVIDIEKTVYVKISELSAASQTLTFDIKYSTPSDNKTFTITTAIDNTAGDNLGWSTMHVGYVYNNNTNVISNAEGDTLEITIPNWYTYALTPGMEATVTATANDGSGATDFVKIIFVDDNFVEPTPTPAATATPEPVPSGKPIDLEGVGYAYIFGYEPDLIERVTVTDDEGNESGAWNVEIRMAPNDSVTREQVAAMLMRMIDQKYDTTGVTYPVTDNIAAHSGTWYERGLAYIASTGAFDGVDQVYTGAVTRGEVAKLIAYGLNLSDTAETSFEDIADSPYKQYIEIMNAYGYMQGISDTEFEPDRVMTRAEFCSMFNQIIGRDDALLESADGTQVTPELYYFVDLEDDAWYTPVMLRATSAYDDNGYVDIDTRLSNIRNTLDNYDSQKLF